MLYRASDELLELLDWTNLGRLTKEYRDRDLCSVWDARKKARQEIIDEVQYGETYYFETVTDLAYFTLWLEESRQWLSQGG